MKKVIVFVDDEPAITEAMNHYFSVKFPECQTKAFVDPVMALDYCLTQPVDLLVTDINMPEINGFQLIKKVRDAGVIMKVIIVSGFYSNEHKEEFSSLGDFSFFTKPVLLKELFAKIKEKIG